MASGDGSRQPPRNLQGLLKFCMEHTKAEDPTQDAPMEPMSEEGAKDMKDGEGLRAIITSPDPDLARERQDKALNSLGLYRFAIPGDGNCLFRAVASQLKFGQESYHPLLRQAAVGWMHEHAEDLIGCGLLDSKDEIKETERLGAWPGQAAVVALANIFAINIVVIQGGDKGFLDIQHISPFETPAEDEEQTSIILAYLYHGHYDAVVDTPDLPNPDYEKWLKLVEMGAKVHGQDAYMPYVKHRLYDTLKGPKYIEMPPSYPGTCIAAESAPPPREDTSQARNFDTSPKKATDHSAEEVRLPGPVTIQPKDLPQPAKTNKDPPKTESGDAESKAVPSSPKIQPKGALAQYREKQAARRSSQERDILDEVDEKLKIKPMLGELKMVSGVGASGEDKAKTGATDTVAAKAAPASAASSDSGAVKAAPAAPASDTGDKANAAASTKDAEKASPAAAAVAGGPGAVKAAPAAAASGTGSGSLAAETQSVNLGVNPQLATSQSPANEAQPMWRVIPIKFSGSLRKGRLPAALSLHRISLHRSYPPTLLQALGKEPYNLPANGFGSTQSLTQEGHANGDKTQQNGSPGASKKLDANRKENVHHNPKTQPNIKSNPDPNKLANGQTKIHDTSSHSSQQIKVQHAQTQQTAASTGHVHGSSVQNYTNPKSQAYTGSGNPATVVTVQSEPVVGERKQSQPLHARPQSLPINPNHRHVPAAYSSSEQYHAQSSTRSQQSQGKNRELLNNVMKELQGHDPVKAMLGHIEVIVDPNKDIEDKEFALEELETYCEDLDLARDFHKIGGFEFLSSLFRSSHAGLRWRAAFLLGTVVQNNPYCQERALEMGLLPMLLQLVDKDPDMKVRVKALFAASSLGRDVPAAQKVFTDHDGFSVLLRAMQSGDEKLQTKAAFMLRAMCVSEPLFKDTLCDMGMVEQLVALLQQEHMPSHEHVMGALVALVENHQRSLDECRRPELRLRELLTARQALLKGKPEYEEEYSHAQTLSKMLSSSSTSGGRTSTSVSLSSGAVDR